MIYYVLTELKFMTSFSFPFVSLYIMYYIYYAEYLNMYHDFSKKSYNIKIRRNYRLLLLADSI